MGYRYDADKAKLAPDELPEVINRWKNELDLLAEGCRTNKVVVLKSDFPNATRWYLYQAIKAAKELDIAPYNKIHVRFRMTKAPGVFYAHPRPNPENVTATVLGLAEMELKTKDIHGVSSLVGLITSLNQNASLVSYAAFRYPDFEPSLIDKVQSWADRMGHEIISTDPLIIKRGIKPEDPA